MNLVTVAQYGDSLQAYITAGRLETEGILVYIADKHYVSLNWYLSQALGGVKLQVPDYQVEQARKILAQMAEGEFAIKQTNDHQSSIRCPRCGSYSFKQQSTRGWTLSLLYIFSLPLFFRPRYCCNHCQYKWKS
jgi:hypothetical protein